MMNSVNTLEFLKPKLITMDKFNTTTTTRILPPPSSLAQTRTFVTFTHHNNVDQQYQQQNLITDEVQQQQQHLRQERVKVQHLQNHTKLQNNNCWNNFRTLYQLSASSGDRDKEMKRTIRESNIRTNANDNDEVDVEHFTTTITNIQQQQQQNTSAFNLDINNKKNYYNIKSIYGNIKESSTEAIHNHNNNNNNTIVNNFHSNHYNGLINNQTPFVLMTPQRTKDQDHAYRHIESVHNYAKLKSYEDDDLESPNGSRHSSFLDDDDDDDEDDNEDDEDENDEEDVYDDRLNPINSTLANDLDADYEVIFNRRRLQKMSTSSDGALTSNANHGGDIRKPLQYMNASKVKKAQSIKNNEEEEDDDDDDDLHIDVDVETVDTQTIPIAAAINPVAVNNHVIDSSPIKPDHHARRPMNAFLIFCKRHRAIVKERYKNLENRAITKILGDWWASLDAEDKKCFTTLAQMNKDAFFSANPNFKWYKLPAPPLRTLTTRPANAIGQEYDDNETNTAVAAAMETISNNTRISSNISNYFKLADETQMGDLSQLMQDKSKTSTKLCAALQQALGETSQFISAHITENAEIVENKQLKRRFDNENSFSSNSSEEDGLLQPTKKSARSCKGKRYQELINSGQIATAVKKSKTSLRLLVAGDNMDLEVKQCLTNLNNNNNIICHKRSVSESEHLMSFDIASFDLEERIKDLPALNLDDYLQRKRNTKKKKKFAAGGKKRGKSSNNGHNCNSNNNNSNQITENVGHDNIMNRNIMQLQQKQAAAAAAVGSQKRKARKESITRRDVSAIEQEVASLLPLTFNGCCYFQEAPPLKPTKSLSSIKAIEKDKELIQNTITTTTTTTFNLTSPIIPLQNSSSSLTSPSSNVDILNNNNLNDNISSSTSDLLILAEVAANRTELKH